MSEAPDCPGTEGEKGLGEQPEKTAEDVDSKRSGTNPGEHAVLSEGELTSVTGGISGLDLGPQWKGLEIILSRSALFNQRKRKTD